MPMPQRKALLLNDTELPQFTINFATELFALKLRCLLHSSMANW